MRHYLFAVCLLALAACAPTAPGGRTPAVLSQPLDAAVQQQAQAERLAASLQQNGKLKIGRGGTLIIQLGGTGNVTSPQQADNRKAGSKQGSAATAPGAASANASQRTAGPPLAVYVGVGLLLVGLGALGWAKLGPKWAVWRARPG